MLTLFYVEDITNLTIRLVISRSSFFFIDKHKPILMVIRTYPKYYLTMKKDKIRFGRYKTVYL